MPTYEFRCNNCGNKWDYQIAIKDLDDVIMLCLICAVDYVFGRVSLDAITLRRVPSVPAVHFKGSGFYSTGG